MPCPAALPSLCRGCNEEYRDHAVGGYDRQVDEEASICAGYLVGARSLPCEGDSGGLWAPGARCWKGGRRRCCLRTAWRPSWGRPLRTALLTSLPLSGPALQAARWCLRRSWTTPPPTSRCGRRHAARQSSASCLQALFLQPPASPTPTLPSSTAPPATQVGLVSGGAGTCGGPSLPALFSRLDSCSSWVQQAVDSVARQGGLPSGQAVPGAPPAQGQGGGSSANSDDTQPVGEAAGNGAARGGAAVGQLEAKGAYAGALREAVARGGGRR